jgi:hypothetical protein
MVVQRFGSEPKRVRATRQQHPENGPERWPRIADLRHHGGDTERIVPRRYPQSKVIAPGVKRVDILIEIIVKAHAGFRVGRVRVPWRGADCSMASGEPVG